jgi:hypothetical protein
MMQRYKTFTCILKKIVNVFLKVLEEVLGAGNVCLGLPPYLMPYLYGGTPLPTPFVSPLYIGVFGGV